MTGKDPSEHYAELTARHGTPAYARVDAPANREEKAQLANLSPEQVTATELAGEPITAKLTEAPGNGAQDRRAQGDHRERLVRRPAVGHRGRLQDLRRVLPGPRAPGPDPERGAGGGVGGAGRLSSSPHGSSTVGSTGEHARGDRGSRHRVWRDLDGPCNAGAVAGTCGV